MDFLAVFPGVHRVQDEARLDFKPADRIDLSVAFHHADEGAFGRLPGPRRQALRRALEIAGERQDREHHVVPGHDEVVDHRRIGCGETIAASHLSGLVRDAVVDQMGKPLGTAK